jgi:hypothetical protein
VLYVENVTELPWAAQGQVVWCLHRQEERAKLVIGLEDPPQKALTQGTIRPDLLFRLRLSQLNVAELGTHMQPRRRDLSGSKPKGLERAPQKGWSTVSPRPTAGPKLTARSSR